MASDKDLWQLTKGDRIKIPVPTKRRKVKTYQLIDKRSGKNRGEICDFSLAIKTAKVMEVMFLTKILISPIYEEMK